MKRFFRIRIMLASLFSFLLLFIVAVTGIFFFSYHRMERETDDFIQDMLFVNEEDHDPFVQNAPPMFGYKPGPRRYPSGFYNLTLAEDGSVLESSRIDISEEADEGIRDQVIEAVASGKLYGKMGSYKYGALANEDGSFHVILLDISIQLRQIYNTLRSAMLVVAGLFVLLILILLPVSSKIAEILIRNAEQQRQFVTDAGHDLKTPVAIIKANLDVLELSQGKNKWSGNIRNQANRLELLVQKLLMLAKLDEAQSIIREEHFCLTDTLKSLWQEYLPAMQQKQIAGRSEISDNIGITADREMIGQMFRLVLDNALQYTEEGGEISLTVTEEKRKVVLTLRNTVSQLPESKPEELTERFVRGNTARTQKSGGSGIGLAAVKRIVSLHHGKLVISYPDHRHFQVRIDLPNAEQMETDMVITDSSS